MKAHLIFLIFIFSLNTVCAQHGVYTFDKIFIKKHTRLTEAHNSGHYTYPYYKSQEGESWSGKFSIPGIVGSIHATGSDGQNLYVGGNFKSAGGIRTNNIVKWDGEKWSSLGGGPENGLNGTVQAITYKDGKLFVGGMFSKAGSEQVYGLVYWDGANWHSVVDSESKSLVRYTIFENDTTILLPFVWELIYGLGQSYNDFFIGSAVGIEVITDECTWPVISL